ncbi:MAG: hypothetical protein DHS20C09_15870 [marine bacterium B5-7]|nr:MAG: hypothetical protein DHS20C09_15870 [marine bacterium B5-7]
MDKAGIDWDILRGSIILFCICLTVGGGLIGGAYYFNNKLSKELKQNKSIFQSISQRYLDVDQEEKLLHEYFPRFVNLYNKGVIGPEKRLNWIEALRQSGEDIKLPGLRYSLDSQEVFTPEFEINYNGYTLYRSNMELNLGLLHEGDLFRLLKYIDQHADGTYTISECKFRLNGNEIKMDKEQANISADCLLHWITIDLASGARIEI